MILFGYIAWQSFELTATGRYTVATTTGQNGKFVEFKLNVHEQEYNSSYPIQKYDVEINGGRYFVKYLPSDPTVCEALWDKPVPECINNPDPEGWVKIPECSE